MKFYKVVLATVTGIFLFIFIFFIFFMLMVGIIASTVDEEAPKIQENSVLYLNLSGTLVERKEFDPFKELLFDEDFREISLIDLLKTIKKAKEDKNIKGIYMEHQFMQSGYATLEEIKNALLDFKTSGKFIYAYGDYISEKDYYLASLADTLYLHPQGMLEFNGLNINITFFKGLLDKLEVEPLVFKVGKFKSAIEPFVQKKMSDENRQQLDELITSIYDNILENIATHKNKTKEELKDISDNMKIQLVEDALTFGFVTKIGYKDEIIDILKQKLKVEQKDEIDFISFEKYEKSLSNKYSKNKIAVIVGEGAIVVQSSNEKAIVGRDFAKEIRKAREDENIKAIVLRVNSPGGSLTASDEIWREISLTKGVKPIVASMSDLAASGGYYISMLCDTIVAQPNTITGSIGIFGLSLNLEKFLENKLGITHDVVKTGNHSDIFTVTRSLTDTEKNIFQNMINRGYKTFTTKVADSRKMSIEDVEKIAQGRVWTGEKAKELGLVDVLGSLDDAVQIAAKKANVQEDYSVNYFPKIKSFQEEIFSKLSENIKLSLSDDYNPIKNELEKIKNLNSLKGIQARLPYEMEFE